MFVPPISPPDTGSNPGNMKPILPSTIKPPHPSRFARGVGPPYHGKLILCLNRTVDPGRCRRAGECRRRKAVKDRKTAPRYPSLRTVRPEQCALPHPALFHPADSRFPKAGPGLSLRIRKARLRPPRPRKMELLREASPAPRAPCRLQKADWIRVATCPPAGPSIAALASK